MPKKPIPKEGVTWKHVRASALSRGTAKCFTPSMPK